MAELLSRREFFKRTSAAITIAFSATPLALLTGCGRKKPDTSPNGSPPEDINVLLSQELAKRTLTFDVEEERLWAQNTRILPFSKQNPETQLKAVNERVNNIIAKMRQSKNPIFTDTASWLTQHSSGENPKALVGVTKPGEGFTNPNAIAAVGVTEKQGEIHYNLYLLLDRLKNTQLSTDADIAVNFVHEVTHLKDWLVFEQEGRSKGFKSQALREFIENLGNRQTKKEWESVAYHKGTEAYLYVVGQTGKRKFGSDHDDLLYAYLISRGDISHRAWIAAVDSLIGK